MFNGGATATCARYAIAGSFDDCQRLTKAAFATPRCAQRVRLTSANSINIGRLLPQMIYYFHAVAQADGASRTPDVVFSTPSGNFGNLTAGLMAKRAGLPIAAFVAATNVNDVVPGVSRQPAGSSRGLGRRPSPTRWTVGNPSNFDRMSWLYGGDLDAMRRDIAGSRHTDDEVRETIRRVYEERGYLLDPHSAIAYLGLTGSRDCAAPGRRGVCSSRRRIRQNSRRSSSRSSAARSRSRRRWRRRSPDSAASSGSTPRSHALRDRIAVHD